MNKHPIRVLVNKADVQGPVTIIVAPTLTDTPDFNLVANGVLVAQCTSGTALSKWAFANGAEEVKHAYDLRLEPEL